jgi:uncharacterized GH25 family protein
VIFQRGGEEARRHQAKDGKISGMIARLIVGLMIFAASAAAHDLFLVVEGEGVRRRVCARIGEHFPESMNAVKLERIVRFRVSTGKEQLDLHGEVDEKAKQTCAFLRDGTARGGKVELLSTPNFIELDAKEFNPYIEGEGFSRIVALRKAAGKSEAPGRELYSRFAKAILPEDTEATRPMGHELEIVPLKDPSVLKKGEALPVRVLFRGKPLTGVQVSAVYAGAKLEGHVFPVSSTTDAKGEAKLELDRPGLWYARLIHMLPSAEAGGTITGSLGVRGASAIPAHDWRSFFATMTFTVPEKK